MTASVVLPEQRAAFRRAWRLTALWLLVPVVVLAAAAAAPDLLPQFVVLLVVVVVVLGLLQLVVHLVLPLSVQQARTRIVDGRLHATTLLGPRTLELDRLRRVGARSASARGGTSEYLSLRADRRVILCWNSGRRSGAPEDLRGELAALAGARPDVAVSERAKVVLRLPDAPGLRRQAVLGLRTTLWCLLMAPLLAVAVLLPAVALGKAVLGELRP